MTPTQLKSTGLLTEKAGIVLGRYQGHTLRDCGEGHVLLVAPSRGGGILGYAGKGTTVVIPSLFEIPYDTVTIDPKGENYEITGPWREAHGSQVFSFDPMGHTSKTSINLLAEYSPRHRRCLCDADTISRGFIPDPGPTKPGPHHYASQGQNILSSVLLYVAEHGTEKSLGGCYRFMSNGHPNKLASAMLASSHTGVQCMPQQLFKMKPESGSALGAATDGFGCGAIPGWTHGPAATMWTWAASKPETSLSACSCARPRVSLNTCRPSCGPLCKLLSGDVWNAISTGHDASLCSCSMSFPAWGRACPSSAPYPGWLAMGCAAVSFARIYQISSGSTDATITSSRIAARGRL